MPDKTSTAEAQTSLAPLTTKERLIAVPGKKSDPEDDERKQRREGAKRSKTGLLQSLKPLLPVLSSGLRLVDHGAVQALAHLLSLVDGNSAASSAAHEELRQGLADLQAKHRDLHLQVQGQTVEMQRIEDQIALIRQTAERSTAKHEELVADVKSLSNLVRAGAVGLAVLLIVLIVLAVMILSHQP